MMDRIHFIQHVDFESPACIKTWADKRELHVSCSRMFAGDTLPEISDFDILVVMGGPMGVYDVDQYPWITGELAFVRQAIDANKKVLGICLGSQLIAASLGAKVYKSPLKEIGFLEVMFDERAMKDEMFAPISQLETVFQWHGDTFDLPLGAELLASSAACKNQAFAYKNTVALQFHLELTRDSLRNLVEMCRHELVEGPYVRTESAILDEINGLDGMNMKLEAFLDKFLV